MGIYFSKHYALQHVVAESVKNGLLIDFEPDICQFGPHLTIYSAYCLKIIFVYDILSNISGLSLKTEPTIAPLL